jgi:hypothetical protein
MACALFCQAAYGKEQETSDPGHDPTTVRTLADEADAHRHRTAFGRLDERTLLRAMVTRSARMPTPNRVQNRRHARNQETRSPLPLKGLDGCAASHVNITLHGPLEAIRPLYPLEGHFTSLEARPRAADVGDRCRPSRCRPSGATGESRPGSVLPRREPCPSVVAFRPLAALAPRATGRQRRSAGGAPEYAS